MTPMAAATAGLLTIVALLSVVWLFSVRLRDVSIVDIWWGPGFVILAWLYCLLLPGGSQPRARLMAVLITVWGLRLAWHIATRHRAGEEDPRYAAMRARRGAAFWWQSLLMVFWLQALLIWIIALPVLAAADSTAPLGLLDIVGAGVFAVGFAFEVTGDHQLRRFKADSRNRGQVLDTGLWRYTRHPNYFGDAVLWWGLYLLAASTPAGRLTIVSPALMTFLLMRVSGVTLLEQSLRNSKPDYDDYRARTSAFVPWFPRKSS
jgi:steroid 5-alpha reductase family enzyme